jgi:hypothetical protein
MVGLLERTFALASIAGAQRRRIRPGANGLVTEATAINAFGCYVKSVVLLLTKRFPEAVAVTTPTSNAVLVACSVARGSGISVPNPIAADARVRDIFA